VRFTSGGWGGGGDILGWFGMECFFLRELELEEFGEIEAFEQVLQEARAEDRKFRSLCGG